MSKQIVFNLSQQEIDRANAVLIELDRALEAEGVDIEIFYNGQGWRDLISQLEVSRLSRFNAVDDDLQRMLSRLRYVEELLRYPGGAYHHMPTSLRENWRLFRITECKTLAWKIRRKELRLEKLRRDLFEVRAVWMAQMIGMRRLSPLTPDWGH